LDIKPRRGFTEFNWGIPKKEINRKPFDYDEEEKDKTKITINENWLRETQKRLKKITIKEIQDAREKYLEKYLDEKSSSNIIGYECYYSGTTDLLYGNKRDSRPLTAVFPLSNDGSLQGIYYPPSDIKLTIYVIESILSEFIDRAERTIGLNLNSYELVTLNHGLSFASGGLKTTIEEILIKNCEDYRKEASTKYNIHIGNPFLKFRRNNYELEYKGFLIGVQTEKDVKYGLTERVYVMYSDKKALYSLWANDQSYKLNDDTAKIYKTQFIDEAGKKVDVFIIFDDYINTFFIRDGSNIILYDSVRNPFFINEDINKMCDIDVGFEYKNGLVLIPIKAKERCITEFDYDLKFELVKIKPWEGKNKTHHFDEIDYNPNVSSFVEE